MKKVFGIMLVVMFMFSLSLVSADRTLINGKILYDGDIDNPVVNAFVNVTCNGNSVVTNSSACGNYWVDFVPSECTNGDIVIVSATKDGLYGSRTGIVEDSGISGLDIAVINVPLVPEFGFFVGMLTILSAVMVFFVVRKD